MPITLTQKARLSLWRDYHSSLRDSVSCAQSDDDISRLFQLSQNGQAAMLDAFLEQKGHNFNINVCNDEGETALHAAARNGKIQTCKVLVRRGADLMPDAYAKTPYDLAVSNGHTYCASLLRAKLYTNAGTDIQKFAARVSGSEVGQSNSQFSAQSNDYNPAAGNYRQPEQGRQTMASENTSFHTAAVAQAAPRQDSSNNESHLEGEGKTRAPVRQLFLYLNYSQASK